jgi:hypothetical protein
MSLAINAGVAVRGPVVVGAGEGIFKDVRPWPEVDILGNPLEWKEGQINIGASNAKLNVVSSNKETEFSLPAKFSLHPNPADTILFIEGLRDEHLIQIVSLSGQVIKQAVISDKLDISDISPGYYLVRIEGYIAKPFIKTE